MKFIYVTKEPRAEGIKEEAFTSLKWALISLSMHHLYRVVHYALSEETPFIMGDVSVKKLKLNHYPYKRKKL